MKFEYKSVISFIIIMIVLIFSASIFAEGPLAKYWQNYDGNTEKTKRLQQAEAYNKTMQEQDQQNIQTAQQQLQEQAKTQAQQQIQSAVQQSGALSTIIQDNQSNVKKTTPLPSCDCYDQNYPYNFPSNFKIDDKKIRVQRIYPPCICEQPNTKTGLSVQNEKQGIQTTQQQNILPVSSSQQPVILNTSATSQSGVSKSKWQIDYN